MNELASLYAKALEDVIKRFEKALVSGKSANIELITIRNLKKAFDSMVQFREDLKEELKASYLDRKVKEIERAAKYMSINPQMKAWAVPDQKEIDGLYIVFNNKLNKAENGIGRRIRQWFDREQKDKASELNKLIRDNMTERAMGGITKKEAVENVVKGLKNNLYVKLIDKNGNPLRFSMASYANLNINAMIQQARNTASINTNKKLGNNLVKFSKHYWTCEICAKYCEGRVYSITRENNKGYPYLYDLQGFKDGYNLIHPNCKHLLSGYWVQGYSKEEIEKTKKLSNSNEDTRSTKMKEKYDTSQQINYYIRQQAYLKRQLSELGKLTPVTNEAEASKDELKNKIAIIKKKISLLRAEFKGL